MRNICATLCATTGEVFTLKQCKNRYGVLKRDWQAWRLLADSRRGATGLGWNPVTSTFTAPDYFWANLIAQNECVAKFRDRPLEHEELMQRVFEEVTATGSLQCTPGAEGELGMGANGRRALAIDNDDRTETNGEGNTVGIENGDEIGSEYTRVEHGRGTPFDSQEGTNNTPPFPQYGFGTTNPFSHQQGNRSSPFVSHPAATNSPPFPQHASTNTHPSSQHVTRSPPLYPQHEYGTPTPHFLNRGPRSTPPCPQPEIRCSPPLSDHATNTPPFPRAMPINPGCNSSGTKRRSRSSGTDALSQSMANILETMTSRHNQYRSVIKHGCKMVDIMKILGRMEYFQQDPVPPVYWWLIDYLSGDPMKMDVFYGLPNDEQRISFAQREHTKEMVAQSRRQGNSNETLPPWI